MSHTNAGALRHAIRRILVASCTSAAIAAVPAWSAELPQPCVAGSCGAGGPSTWVTSGNAAAVLAGNSLTINQSSENAVLNWSSFNISEDGTVTFVQPGASSVALNRIHQADPSRIFGNLNANGRIYLLNQNGILFGEGARVNVGGLIASALDITPDALQNGIAQAARTNSPAFAAGADDPSGAVTVRNGARIQTSSGGQVFLFAPESVTNEGTIVTPDGQTILAAGRSVYLSTSTDQNLRGLLVEVDAGGVVSNGRVGGAAGRAPQDVVGQVVAERGNITLAGLAVNQHGRLSATTSVRSNGTIRLQARDTVLVQQEGGISKLAAQRGGELLVGQQAVNEVTLARDDTQTQVDVNKQLASAVTMDGAQVRLLEGSRTTATSGNVTITARRDPQSSPNSGGGFSPEPNDARLYIASGAAIDVSGADVDLPMERNVVRVELRGSQVANSPAQRDGALRGQTVFVDARRTGTRADGTTWQGTALADVSGDIAAVGRTVGERNLRGGTVTLQSQGSVLVGQNALIDVSGGSIRYQDGFINTTQLLSNGRTYDIGDADPNRRYEGIGNVFTVRHSKWGVTQTYSGHGPGSRGRFEEGYVEGKDAGSVSIAAPWAAFDGTIDGSVVRGPHQRLPGTTVADSQLYRPYDQVPMGGRLELGFADPASSPNAVFGDVRFAPGAVLPALLNDNGTAFDPSIDLLPANRGETRIRPELLGPTGVSQLTVYSNGRITVPADVALSTPAGGRIAATGAGLRIEGSINSPSGSIELTARNSLTQPAGASLLVGAQSRLNALGGWVNDSPLTNGPGAILDPLFTGGGRVSLSAQQGELRLAAGSEIDVSGGAWRQAGGRIVAGSGGSVSLSTTPNSTTGVAAPVPLVTGADIRGHSVGAGGQFSVTASSVCIAADDCSGADETVLWVDPEFLRASGFGSYRVGSNRNGLSVADGTQIELRQRNLQLLGELEQLASADSVLRFSRVTMLDDFERRPVSLTLNVAANPGVAVSSSADFAALGGLTIGSGSAILGDARAAISLRSSSRMIIDGHISAPAGSISAQLGSDLTLNQYFADSQAIWLGEHARLSTAGVARIRTDDRGHRQGDVLAGGTVALNAQRGYVVALPGSVIDVSGTSAVLDIRSDSRGGFPASEVSSDAGRIAVSAAEGFLLNADLRAHAGGSGSAGGELSLTLDPGQRVDAGSPVSWFPTGPRTIEVREHASPVAIAPGTAIPGTFNGYGAIAVADIEEGGFGALSVTARELEGRLTGAQELRSRGVIRFDGDVQLALDGSITLDAAILDVPGRSTLAAPVVSIGASSRRHQSLPAAIDEGSGELTVRAGLLEFYGNIALRGIQSANLAAAGDVRFRGVQLIGMRRIEGSLVSSGDLTFSARQLYPTTLTQFNVEARGEESSIRVLPAAGARAPVLSAGGTLGLRANSIVNEGVLRAPFGTVALTGEHVTLAAGSLVSTSAEGLVIPFGQTQGGFDWVYPLLDQGGANGQTLVFGRGPDGLPQQRATLDAADIRIESGATIDLSGGGDLLAYEFEPGVGGTRDVLSNTHRRDQYAVVPGLGLDYAPFDQNIFEGSNLRLGDSVHLSGIPGLPAGRYTLLPARYALLPGAFLVTAVDGYQDILPGERYAQLDGSTVTAGYRSVIGTDIRDARTGGFAVRSGADAQREARYKLSRATEFIAARAAREGIATPRLPNDAGILNIDARGQLILDGSLRASAGKDGRGAAVDISGDRLRIANAGAAARDGEVLVDAAALSRLGAESVLVGARRSQTADGVRLDVSADEVVVDANLAAPELLLAARDRVEITSSGSVSVAGKVADADEALLVSGDGALFRASAGRQMRIERTNGVGAQGTLSIAEGAVVSARSGAVLLDATQTTKSNGRLDVAGASLNLSAARIGLGRGEVPVEGLVLDGTQFSGLDLRELVLTSRSVVDLYGDVDLGVRQLTLHAGGIVHRTGGNASLTAGEVLSLANPNGVAAPAALAGDGSLTLSAREIRLGAGDFAVEGVANARFSASRQIIAQDRGATTTSGDLQLAAPRITSVSGAGHTIAASGALTTIAQAAAGDAQNTTLTPGVGGRLVFQAQSILHGGRIEMPAGDVRLEAIGADAAGGITLASGSSLSLTGTSRSFDGVEIAAPGGVATLVSRNGSIVAESGSAIDVSAAATSGDAGKIVVEATRGAATLAGALSGRAATGEEGGSISVDAASLGSLDALNGLLNTGGFNRVRTFRQRGAGDLVVSEGSGAAINARSVSLAADQGSTIVNGLIDASGRSGGSVTLAARDNVVVNGTVLANATAAGGRGGSVLLSSTEGGVLFEAGARIDVSAGAARGPEPVRAGEVLVRLPRAGVLSILDANVADQLRLDGSVIGAGRYWVEGYAAYLDADGVLDANDVAPLAFNPLYADAGAFMANAPAITAALDRTGDAAFKVVPGVEVRSAGNLTLASDWNLYDWHFHNDAPGILTLRAGGDLIFDRSLSDGFSTLPDPNIFDPELTKLAFRLADQRRESWSYRLIGGADLSSSDALATQPARQLNGGGNVRISAGTCCVPADPNNIPDYRMIRTGTGDIAIRAAGDLQFGDPNNRTALDQTAVIYTAGVSGPGIRLPGDFGGLDQLPYPVEGGDISIRTGGSVRGAPSDQLVTDWLWRVGSLPSAEFPSGSPTAWTVNFGSFMQGVGALAGGNVELVAGGDVENVSLNLPTIGRQIGGANVRDNAVEVVGAGDMRVEAGGSILGGTYLIGNGSAQLRARDSITAPSVRQRPTLQRPVGTLLGIVGGGGYELVARKDVEIDSAFNATLIRQGTAQQVFSWPHSFFLTYGEQSRLELLSISGDVTLHNDPSAARELFTSASLGGVDSAALHIYPGTVRATGFDGDVRIPRSMFLSPAPKGNLELFAQNDVVLGDKDSSLVLSLSDADLATLPSVTRPTTSLELLDTLLRSPPDPNQHGRVPVHSLANQPDGIADTRPVRVVARTGDISMETDPLGGITGLYLSKQARFVAGEDIRELSLFGQHTALGDVTTLSAGGDISYGLNRNQAGSLLKSIGGIVLDGPGRLELIAGGDVDLQASDGIVTRGNLRNAALPDGGAAVSVLTGLGERTPNYAAFSNAYLRDIATYDKVLLDFLAQVTGARDLSKSQALALFATLTEGQRNGFLQSVLFAELRASGRAAARDGSADFTRGFTALETMFPGSNPDREAGEVNAYSGSFNGYFSRVYTLDGGDITLLAPGGEINVGLATPPASFGISKAASELGVVAQSTGSVSALTFNDFAVNESRVFAADGGDILVWSTDGDIDAGRGAKTAISAPSPIVSFDANGNVQVSFPAALAGSGIQTLATSAGRKPGNVDLFAPRGVVNAGDAGIVAGNLTIAATAVLGVDNIQVSGVAVGVPVDAGGLGASLAGVSATASSASNSAAASVDAGRDQQEQKTPLADTALSWLEVFVVGLGEDGCRQDDVACLKRQSVVN